MFEPEVTIELILSSFVKALYFTPMHHYSLDQLQFWNEEKLFYESLLFEQISPISENKTEDPSVKMPVKANWSRFYSKKLLQVVLNLKEQCETLSNLKVGW